MLAKKRSTSGIPIALYSDSLRQPTRAIKRPSSDKGFGLLASNSCVVVAILIADSDASRMGFRLSIMAAFTSEGRTALQSFPCATLSTAPRTDPITLAETGFRLLCESESRSFSALRRLSNDFISEGFALANIPLQLCMAEMTSSMASFRNFHAVFPSFVPIFLRQSMPIISNKLVRGISMPMSKFSVPIFPEEPTLEQTTLCLLRSFSFSAMSCG
mmetsp:Transcript_14350/g.21894  ORF Transcript_14350/g.21894 Transcript_14350/m.21894 type:complete len:216 (-) Transcript_14350:2665-3312(-)